MKLSTSLRSIILKNLKRKHEVVLILEKHIIMAYKEVPCISSIFSTIYTAKGEWLASHLGESFHIHFTVILVAHRAILGLMMINIFVFKFVIWFCFVYLIVAARNEGTATQSWPACPGAAGGNRAATGTGSTPKCCHCLSEEEDSGILLPHVQRSLPLSH